ncbi:hypothetical protein LY78DRAFT_215616 [Colletotrichum sublineola]|nr:hypothetical protein LY78DRAFT_215616 [Colletotrichum sublineola]
MYPSSSLLLLGYLGWSDRDQGRGERMMVRLGSVGFVLLAWMQQSFLSVCACASESRVLASATARYCQKRKGCSGKWNFDAAAAVPGPGYGN